MARLKEKGRAIEFRKRGLSYNEILRRVPVAKSTLSLWLRSVRLAKRQKQKLTAKKLAGALRGAKERRRQRQVITERIKKKAREEIGKINKRELGLIGITLYWAEGSKQKEYNPSEKVIFTNSDPKMIRFFLRWLKEICNIEPKDITFYIDIHKTADGERAKRYWSRITNLPLGKFQKITWKKHKIKTKRKNVGKNYYGLLRMKVKRSTSLNRKIMGWIEGICKNI